MDELGTSRERVPTVPVAGPEARLHPTRNLMCIETLESVVADHPSRSRPRHIYLYRDPAAPEIDAKSVAGHLERTTGTSVEVRDEFFSHHGHGGVAPLAEAFARARVVDPLHLREPVDPSYGLVRIEERLLGDPAHLVPGVLYDGMAVMDICRSLLPAGEASLGNLHIVLTRRLLGTFDEGDRRYHARTIVAGSPCIISTSGLVEAPAKPREFYVQRRGASALGVEVPLEVLKEELGSRFLDYGDPRATEVAKGYALQAYAYHVLGDPFCDDPDCRLYNAHWQEEMLRAQVDSGALCGRHAALLSGG